MCDFGQRRQEEQAVTGNSYQNVRVEAGSASALRLAEGVEGGDLCTVSTL